MKTLIATLFLLFSSAAFAGDNTAYCVEVTVGVAVEILHKAETTEEAVVQQEFGVRARKKGFSASTVHDFVAMLYRHMHDNTKIQYDEMAPMIGECERLIEKAEQGANGQTQT